MLHTYVLVLILTHVLPALLGHSIGRRQVWTQTPTRTGSQAAPQFSQTAGLLRSPASASRPRRCLLSARHTAQALSAGPAPPPIYNAASASVPAASREHKGRQQDAPGDPRGESADVARRGARGRLRDVAQRAREPRLVRVGRGVRLERDDGGERQALSRWARISPRPVADVPSATRGERVRAGCGGDSRR